jgi:uncharacterized repeat protein (TIGR01451 family)
LALIIILCGSVSAADVSDDISITNDQSNFIEDEEQNQVTDPPEPKHSISGTVLDCQTNDSFQGALISVKTLNGEDVASNVTDENGNYNVIFTSTETLFKVTASSNGHVSPSKDVAVNPSDDLEDSNLYGTANFHLGTLALTKGSWDIIGLDHNNVNQGPNQYVIQIHVTNNALTTANNVAGTLAWTTTNPYVYLAPGQSPTVFLGDLAPGETRDIFYLVEVARNSNAYDTTRNYTITVSGDNTGAPADTITGQLYVQKLISQNRNDVVSITVSNPTPTVGDYFAVTVVSTTASAAYDVVNLPIDYNPALVKPISYNVTYGPNTSNNIRLDNPGQTNYVSVWVFEALSAGSNQFLAVIMDRSGISYHYNNDFGQSNIIEVVSRADLAVTKTVDNPNPLLGETVNFTITVTNNGPNNATGVNVNDNMVPIGSMTFSSATPSKGSWNPGTGIWTIGDLAIGETVTLVFQALINQLGQITNIAHVTGNEEDPNPLNNQALVVLSSEQPTADVGIVKTTNNHAPHVGEIFNFIVQVFNSGPDTATNVIVTDTWPGALEIISAVTSQGTFDQGALIWNVGTLLPSTIATLNITARGLVPGIWTNTVDVTASEFDPHPEDNTSSVNVDIHPEIDLAVQKTVNNTSPNVGQNVVFTVTVTNLGPQDATGVIVNDLLPPGLIYVSSNPSKGSYNSGTGIWNIGNLVKDEIVSLNITVTVNATGQITNIAIASGNEHDHHPENNQGIAVINGGPTADLNIIKTANQLILNNGENIVFNFVLKNDGPNDATNAVVNDLIPVGLEFVSATTSQGSYDPITGVWSVGNLANQVTATMEIIVKAVQTGFITNIADTSADQFDPHPEDNVDAVTVQILPSADLAITKSVDDTQPNIGEQVTFTLIVTNNGPNNATGVVVMDLLPPELIFNSATPSQGTYDSITGIWNIGSLNVNQIVTLLLLVTVDAEGEITNLANVSGNQNDPNLTNNQAISILNGQPAADLAIQKTADNLMPHVGDLVTFTINLYNAGPSNATNVIVTDTVNPINGLIFDSYTATQGTYNSLNGIWTVGDLNYNSSAQLTLKFIVNSIGQITNTVVAAADEEDPHPEDNTSSVTVNGQPSADIGVEKTIIPTTQNYGGQVTHIITVTNHGPSNATDVVVTDILPDGAKLIYVSSNPSQGTFSELNNAWNIGNLLNGESATLEIIFTVNGTGEIVNTATKTHANEFDPNSENDSSSATLTVPSAADIAVGKTVSNTTPNYLDYVTWTVTATNNGPDTATGVVITDILPVNLSLVSVNPSQGTFVGGVWNVGALLNGASATLNIFTRVITSNAATTNIANLTALDQYDWNDTNNSGNATITVPPAADLYLIVNTTTECIRIGNNVLIQFKLGNNGPDTAENVVVRWVVPKGMQFVSATPEPGFGTANYNSLTRTVTWIVGDLAVTDSYLNIIVKLLTPGLYVIEPTVSSDTFDPISADVTPADVCAVSTNGTNGTNGTGVPMQPTGMPLVPLLMGILAVFTGLITKKIRF